MRNLIRFLLFIALGVFTAVSGYSQITTSGINGKVTNPDGSPLPGATVIATHVPTGSLFGASTDAGGLYRLPNMEVGGPYTVKVTFVGFESWTQENIYLTLGQTYRINVQLKNTEVRLGEIAIVGRRGDKDVFDGNSTGTETNVTIEKIQSMPSIARGITDFTRLTPQARVTQLGGIEIAGTNNRFNSIYLDGAVSNDVFGLTDQGTNGGQAGISPFSIDIIEQFSVQVAPFDVKIGGFAGAGINAVTRRGTNEIQGSAYYYMRNATLAGKTPTDDTSKQRINLPNFNSSIYGFRLGGPIVKNKLFFFVNAEIQKEETPQPFDFGTYQGTVTAAELTQLNDKLVAWGYDPGVYDGASRTLDGTKLFGRIDWNISKVHKLMIRHQYTRGVSVSPGNSSTTNLRYSNSGILFPSTTNSSAVELKSNFNDRLSNNLILGLTFVRDDRDPIGNNFPYVRIKDGNSNIYFGSEEFSTANDLKQDIITLTDNFDMNFGKHTITIGTHNEFYKMYNLFIRQNFGSYQFNSIADFLGDKPAYQYDRTFSAVDNITGDGSVAAANFKAVQFGFYIQDKFQVSDRFNLTYGLRADIPMFLDQPLVNADFNDNVIPILVEKSWDLKSAKTGQTPSPKIMLNPRVGFNYDVLGDKTLQIRGGAGLFTSRIPYVWPGASFQNNAVITGGMRVTAAGSPELLFNHEWNNQPSLPPTQPSGQVDIFAKDFKFPKIFRTGIALDKKLPWGLVGTIDFTFSKTINNIMYYNLAYVKTDSLTGTGDDRPIWSKIALGKDPNTNKNRAYTDIILGTNTDKGYSYNITGQLTKNFSKGFSGSVAYTFGRAYSMNDGVSSQNSSQWRVPNVRGKNDLDLSISNFDLGHRIVSFLSYKIDYANHAATTISLFYTGQSGERFSYGYADGSSKYLGEDNQSLELMYVPKDQSDIFLVDLKNSAGDVTLSAAQQWTDLEAFINSDAYLSTRKGNYVERNHSRVPFTNIFDLHIAQDFYINVGGKRNTLQIGLDVYNLGNLINKDWGRIYYASGAYYSTYPLIKFQGFKSDGTTPQFSFTKPKGSIMGIDDSGLLSSRWQAQLSIRYIFN
ncbi:MAG: TonB-dependent receptor [Porphyromonadaceae bacterium]|nr:MAG: TonB-dependent receptor [Porphyromonadaceae bacterium]